MRSAKVLVIRAESEHRHYFADLWRFRELLAFLAWRDVLVRYKQTVIGVAWGVIRPLLMMLIFTFVFGKLAKLPSNGAPYPILVLAGLLPWHFFATALSECSTSLLNNSHLVSKVYFPRLIVPTSSVIVSLVDFAISLLLLAGVMAYFGYMPSLRVLALPLFVLIAFTAAVGAGLLLAALNVKYRDFKFITPFVIQIGMYASPVGYLSSLVPPEWRLVYSLNPMVGVIDGFRWAILGEGNPLYMPGLALSCALTCVIFVVGFVYFRATEKTFADVI